MQEPNPNRKIILIALGIAAVVLLIIAIIFSISHKPKAKATTKAIIPSGTTVDKNNGDIISNPQGKVPEPGSTATSPVFTGIDDLLDHGMTSYQTKNLEQGMLQFKKTGQLFSILSSSINVQVPDSSGNQTTSFQMQIDNGTIYYVKLISSGPTTSQVVVLAPYTNAQVFASSEITNQ